MKEHFRLAANFTDTGDIVDHADLIIHVHDGDQRRVFPNRIGNLLGGNQPILTGLQIGDFESLFFEMTARVKHGFVLDFRSHNMLATGFVELSDPFNSEVVRFSSARRPDDFSRITMQQISNLLPREFHGLFCFPAKFV